MMNGAGWRSATRCPAGLAVAFLLMCTAAARPSRSAHAQPVQGVAVSTTTDALWLRPGEQLTYSVKYGPLRVGTATLSLTTGDTVRGRPTLHASMRIRGGTLFFKVRDQVDSWFDAATLSSLRFTQHLREGSYHADRVFDIYPSSASYVHVGVDTAESSVSEPLDDASFLYFLRSIPLEPGRSYEFWRYFQPESNPIVIKVLRRERITVPAGTFDAVVVQPMIKTSGLFSKNGRAEVWLNANGSHELLQLKSRLAIGSLDLYLTGIGTVPAVDSTDAGR